MSFRNRLGLFFVLIVIVPMTAVAILLFALVAKSERAASKADVSARQQVASALFGEHLRAAKGPLETVAHHDDVLRAALLKGDVARARKRAGQLVASGRMTRIVLMKNGAVVFGVGDKTAIAPASLQLKSRSGPLGQLWVSVIDARSFAEEVRRLAQIDVVVRNGAKQLATTLHAEVPRSRPRTARSTRTARSRSTARASASPPSPPSAFLASTSRSSPSASCRPRTPRLRAATVSSWARSCSAPCSSRWPARCSSRARWCCSSGASSRPPAGSPPATSRSR